MLRLPHLLKLQLLIRQNRLIRIAPLNNRQRRAIPPPKPRLEHARVSPLSVGESRREIDKDLLAGCLRLHERIHLPAGEEGSLFPVRDHPVGDPAELLRFRDGGFDALVLDQRGYLVTEEGAPVRVVAREFSELHAVLHLAREMAGRDGSHCRGCSPGMDQKHRAGLCPAILTRVRSHVSNSSQMVFGRVHTCTAQMKLRWRTPYAPRLLVDETMSANPPADADLAADMSNGPAVGATGSPTPLDDPAVVTQAVSTLAERITALEGQTPSAGAASASKKDLWSGMQHTLEDLKSLRTELITATSDLDERLAELSAVKTENQRLKYRVRHLLRSLDAEEKRRKARIEGC